MENKEIAIRIAGVKKQYRLGQISGSTFQHELQSWWAAVRGREDPNAKVIKNRLTGNQFMALDGIDLTVYAGERVGIIGRNGAGKSTLLKLLSRVTAPTEGEIDIYGRVVSMLEVGTGFSGEMTGRENIYMNGAILGMSKAEIDAKMKDIIAFSEVEKFIDTPVKRYSSGMYVKLAFAVAAHLDAEIIIMDEVLAVGDVAFQQKCLDKMSEVSAGEGKTVLYVSHNMNTIRRLCSRCIVLDEGRVIYDGDVETAIGIYLYEAKDNDSICDHYVYDDSFRHLEWGSPYLRIEELSLRNEGFTCGEMIPLQIVVSAQREWRNVFFRFEISLMSGLVVGTMLSDRGIDFAAGERKRLSFLLDTAHLTPAKYRVDLVAFLTDALGKDQFVDGIYPAFVFELRDSGGKVWHQELWSAIRLHDAVVIESDGKEEE